MKMDSEAKTIQEINLLLLQQKDLKSRLLLDWLKLVGLFLGAIAVFWVIQAPDSEHKRKSEITKLYFQAITIENPEIRAQALGHLRMELNLDQNDTISVLANSAECSAVKSADFIRLKNQIIEKEKELQLEVEGLGSSGISGRGPRYKTILIELNALGKRAQMIQEQLNFCK